MAVNLLESQVPDKSHGQDKEWEKQIPDPKVRPESEVQKPVVMPPPFLGRLANDKKEKEEKKSSKCSGRWSSKRGLVGDERVNVGENVSAVLQKKVLPKYKDQGVIIQLSDRSVIYPEGLLEDVLVKVNELVFLADFYIINMEEDNSTNLSEIFLGIPFLSTASSKIDV
ncbi:uncharacterized protein [Gossypium hirsutum]|uniref:Uncharacterized protein n=1 Tax=Gossypium hirsutum TaxID=3635 RepID=A0A1U8P832_GOSHI|nr:uncharacterized protein LOC107956060 [Gossypium hirsutum]